MEEYAALGVELVEIMPTTSVPIAFVSEVAEKIVPRLTDIGTP